MTYRTIKLVLSLALVLQAVLVFATDQISDIVYYRGEKFYMSFSDYNEKYPLYPLLTDETYTQHMEKDAYGTPKLSKCLSSACYRNYQAVWEIKDSTLYLREVLDCCTHEQIFVLKTIFGEQAVTDYGVKATWVNQWITIDSKPFSIFTLLEDKTSYSFKIENGKIVEFRN